MASATSNTESKGPKLNRLGLAQADYKGAPSTLCAGCGHDSITAQIIKAFWEMGIEPTQVSKLSGIGCSSKTPTYFLSQAHGYNGCHGRMPATATGAFLANRTLLHIGISGDGDTASIGMGQFMHMVRRNLPIVYIIENNGVYGLTKGQFSATADKGSLSHSGKPNTEDPVDCCLLALSMGCEYVARSFSGDFNQLNALLKGAMAHRGTAVIDVISPCMTFNNHEGSTKSQAFVKANRSALHDIDYLECAGGPGELTANYGPGEVITIDLDDEKCLVLKKLERDYDPTDKTAAFVVLEEARKKQQILTGLFYRASAVEPLDEHLEMIDTPLAQLPESLARPSAEALAECLKAWS